MNKLEEIDLIYASMPKLDCKRLCQNSCGPIQMSRAEWERIIAKLGHEPRGDARTMICPMLKDGACSVYAIRPIICRLWGMVEKMRCPHGCIPEGGFLTDKQAFALMQRIFDVSDRKVPIERTSCASLQVLP